LFHEAIDSGAAAAARAEFERIFEARAGGLVDLMWTEPSNAIRGCLENHGPDEHFAVLRAQTSRLESCLSCIPPRVTPSLPVRARALRAGAAERRVSAFEACSCRAIRVLQSALGEVERGRRWRSPITARLGLRRCSTNLTSAVAEGPPPRSSPASNSDWLARADGRDLAELGDPVGRPPRNWSLLFLCVGTWGLSPYQTEEPSSSPPGLRAAAGARNCAASSSREPLGLPAVTEECPV